MSGFEIGWLDLRESADNAARDGELANAAMSWLESRANGGAGPIVVDLGAGTGSTLRALSRYEVGNGAWNVSWRLVDQDRNLLEEALRRHGEAGFVQASCMNIGDVEALPVEGAALVTASALFDLVGTAFVDSLIERLRRERCALYAALNYDGVTEWHPAHPLDAEVLEAFNRDQRRDKGLGPALGPGAAACLSAALHAAGFTVRSAASPWQLAADDAALVSALVQGIATALENSGLEQEALRDWKNFRLANAASGTCRIGHQDILALPPS